jgi:hypothetical protein
MRSLTRVRCNVPGSWEIITFIQSTNKARIFMKIVPFIFAGLVGICGLLSLDGASAANSNTSIAALIQNKSSLAGQTITASGKVVKVNNGIMGRNFVHVQDGTGEAGNNTLIVTSKQTAKVGDVVTISGTVVLNRDFGSGYSYPLLIEEASIASN